MMTVRQTAVGLLLVVLWGVGCKKELDYTLVFKDVAESSTEVQVTDGVAVPDGAETPDWMADVSADAVPDTVADAAADAVPDVAVDVFPDAAVDVVPDIAGPSEPGVLRFLPLVFKGTSSGGGFRLSPVGSSPPMVPASMFQGVE